MKILLTGCAGFIGFHLTKRIVSDNHSVVGIDNLNQYYDSSLKYARLAQLGITANEFKSGERFYHDNFCFIRMDIEDKKNLDFLFAEEKFDVICHLAAQAGVRYSIENPQQYISTNIQGFFNILECCRYFNVKHLVYASSSSVYGKNKELPYKESDKADMPVSLYAATKKAGELLAHSYSELYGFYTTGLRFFTVYGPWGRPDMAPFLFTEAIIQGKPINVFNQGNMFRDFTYVDDVVNGTYKVLLSENTENDLSEKSRFRIYNIGNSAPVKLHDFISIIEKLTGNSAIKENYPMQAGDVEKTWADTSLLRNDFGYTPCVSIEAGLTEFVNWYKGYYITSHS